MSSCVSLDASRLRAKPAADKIGRKANNTTLMQYVPCQRSEKVGLVQWFPPCLKPVRLQATYVQVSRSRVSTSSRGVRVDDLADKMRSNCMVCLLVSGKTLNTVAFREMVVE